MYVDNENNVAGGAAAGPPGRRAADARDLPLGEHLLLALRGVLVTSNHDYYNIIIICISCINSISINTPRGTPPSRSTRTRRWNRNPRPQTHKFGKNWCL